eukprot:gene686-576_t
MRIIRSFWAKQKPKLTEFYYTHVPDINDAKNDWFYLRLFQLPMFLFGIWFGAYMNYKWWGNYIPFEGEQLRRLLPPEAVPEYLEDKSTASSLKDRLLPWKSAS